MIKGILHRLAFKTLNPLPRYFRRSSNKKLDLYQTLGVDKSADQATIKKAYYKLAQQLHPDKNTAPDAKERFAEINNAYQILSDEGKREVYDRTGSTESEYSGFENEQVFRGFGGRKGGGFQTFWEEFEDMFTGGQKRERTKRGGQDISIHIDVDFFQSVRGVEKKANYVAKCMCDVCKGTKSKPGSKPQKCNSCQGSGKQFIRNGGFVIAMECSSCEGQGTVIRQKCTECKGQGATKKHLSEVISIPRGVTDGATLRFSQKGNYSETGGKSGDLIVKVVVKPNSQFKRQGVDVLTSATISVYDAILGAQIDIKTIYNDLKTVKIPSGTQPGARVKLSGEGFYKLHSNEKGNHYVQVKVEIPKSITAEERQAFQQLREKQNVKVASK